MTSTSPETGPNMGPAIEKKYGKPISDWMDVLGTSPLTKNSELVKWLKTDHAVGHGHSMWLVHKYLREKDAA